MFERTFSRLLRIAEEGCVSGCPVQQNPRLDHLSAVVGIFVFADVIGQTNIIPIHVIRGIEQVLLCPLVGVDGSMQIHAVAGNRK